MARRKPSLAARRARRERAVAEPLRERLMVARAQLRAVRDIVAKLPTKPSSNGHRAYPPALPGVPGFVQICTVRRGYADILTALDETGQIWELQTTLGEKVAGQPRPVISAVWVKVQMGRQ